MKDTNMQVLSYEYFTSKLFTPAVMQICDTVILSHGNGSHCGQSGPAYIQPYGLWGSLGAHWSTSWLFDG